MAENIDKEAPAEGAKGLNFVEQIVADDLAAGKNGGRLNTRFPPEPNGYLHIGHAKAICMDFGVAEKFGGTCNLRFDDTNPIKEDTEYVDAIREDIHWLGFDWADREYYASDYFPQLYDLAVKMIKDPSRSPHRKAHPPHPVPTARTAAVRLKRILTFSRE